jgi:anti-sigma factor (TIGR02949 family)
MTPHDRLSCEELVRRLDSYLDRELTPNEVRLVHEHLEGCAKCAAEYAFEGSLLRELKSKVRRLQAPAGLLDRIARRIAEVDRGGGS